MTTAGNSSRVARPSASTIETLASAAAAIEQDDLAQQEHIAELEQGLKRAHTDLATCTSEHTDRAAEQERRSADLTARAAEHHAELTQRNASLAARVDERDRQTLALQTIVDAERGSNADLQRIVYEQGMRCLDLQRQSEDANEMARQLEAAHCYIDILETDRDEHAKRRRIESDNESEQAGSVEALPDEIHNEDDEDGEDEEDEQGDDEDEDDGDNGEQYHLSRTLEAAGRKAASPWWLNRGVANKYVVTKHREFDVFLAKNGLPPIGRTPGSGPRTGFVVTETQARVIFHCAAETSKEQAWRDHFAALLANPRDFLACLSPLNRVGRVPPQ